MNIHRGSAPPRLCPVSPAPAFSPAGGGHCLRQPPPFPGLCPDRRPGAGRQRDPSLSLFGDHAHPILSFTVRHLGLSGGIVITASHNPAPTTAIRSTAPTAADHPGGRRDIKEQIDEVDLLRGVRRVSLSRGRPADASPFWAGRSPTPIWTRSYPSPCCRPSGKGGAHCLQPLHGAGFSWVTQPWAGPADQVTVVPSPGGPRRELSHLSQTQSGEAQAMEEGIRWSQEAGGGSGHRHRSRLRPGGRRCPAGGGFPPAQRQSGGALLLDLLCRRRQRWAPCQSVRWP